MKATVLILLAITCAACSARTSAQTSSIVYRKEVILSTPVHVVYANLNDRNVKVTVALSKRGRGSSEAASSIIARTRPAAAITGTFFDLRTLLPTGGIRIGGNRVHTGSVGSALCITRDNKATIVARGARPDEADTSWETALEGGPSLVANGRIAVDPRAEGFRDPRLSAATRKTAAGITAANKLILVSVNTPVSIHRLAKIMLQLGTTQAMLLDGGSSTMLYANGRFLSYPARRLTNVLMVYASEEAYLQAAGQLAPTLLKAEDFKAPAPVASDAEPWYRQIVQHPEKTETVGLPMFETEVVGLIPRIDLGSLFWMSEKNN